MLTEMTITGFLHELGSNSPAPGGGSIAALTGALGGALAAMVCRLTVDNDKYNDVQSEIRLMLTEADQLSAVLAQYIDEDTAAFNKVMAAYKLPKGTNEEKAVRSRDIQEAMRFAAELPLKVAESCLKVLSLANRALVIGNANAASDAAVAGLMAHAGLHGALFNVKINLSSIKDEQFITAAQERMAEIIGQDEHLQQNLLLTAGRKIG